MMITAPNAPIARAQAMDRAMASPGAASGSVTRQKTRRGRSPSSPACCSRRGSTLANGAGVIWLALLGPVIALLAHLSWSAIASALTAPGALDPLVGEGVAFRRKIGSLLEQCH